MFFWCKWKKLEENQKKKHNGLMLNNLKTNNFSKLEKQ